MTKLVGEYNMLRVLLDNQVTLHIFKNETLMSKNRDVREVSIDVINSNQTYVYCPSMRYSICWCGAH